MDSKGNEKVYELNINGVVIPYTLVKSSRRRTISIQIRAGGEMTVRTPYFVSKWVIDSFLREKQDWIYNHYMEAVRKAGESGGFDYGVDGSEGAGSGDGDLRATIRANEGPALVNKHKKYARKIFEARVAYFQQFTGGNYTSITIRDQKTRWGSCSGRGTLSFNWRLILAPPEILDYVVVHELCHLTHMNHSKEFWGLVSKVLPDYKVRRKWLKENGHTLRL